MPKSLLAGNWKLNCLSAEAKELAAAVVAGCGEYDDRDVMLAPTFTSLGAVAEAVAGSDVALGAQNIYWETSGAFTGEISGPMLRDAGADYVIIGHSERRQFFGETDYTVAKKVAAAHAAGLIPVMCVGETLEHRESGAEKGIVETQVRHGLVEFPQTGMGTLVIAYEPVWAIGTGKTASAEQAEEMHAHIRSVLSDVAESDASEQVRILYGGSVKPGNVDELMACPNINGALVGGASLVADDFLRIVNYQEFQS